MSWSLDRRDRAVVVTMDTNRLSVQGATFFRDLNETFDRLAHEHGDASVVLTGTGATFSAGLDLAEHLALFERGSAAVDAWYDAYRRAVLRVFTYPRLVVAAVNGHALAGGLVLAGACDVRVAGNDDRTRVGMIETAIGLPVPAAYVRMLAHAWGEHSAARLCGTGQTITTAEAFRLGVVDVLAPAADVVERAVAVAQQVPANSTAQFEFTKRAAQAVALRDIDTVAARLDREVAAVFTSDAALRALRQQWAALHARSR